MIKVHSARGEGVTLCFITSQLLGGDKGLPQKWNATLQHLYGFQTDYVNITTSYNNPKCAPQIEIYPLRENKVNSQVKRKL